MNRDYITQLAENALTAAAGAVSLVLIGESADVIVIDWSVIGMAAGTGALMSIVKSLAAPGRQTFFAVRKPGKYERI